MTIIDATWIKCLSSSAITLCDIHGSDERDWLDQAAAVIRQSIAPQYMLTLHTISSDTIAHQDRLHTNLSDVNVAVSCYDVGMRSEWLEHFADLYTGRSHPEVMSMMNATDTCINASLVQQVISESHMNARSQPCVVISIWADSSMESRSNTLIPEYVLQCLLNVLCDRYFHTLQCNSTRKMLLARLTDTQQSVLHLLLAGMTPTEIALELNRSTHTIHHHIKGIYKAWNVNRRVDLITRWASINNTTPNDPRKRKHPRISTPDKLSDTSNPEERTHFFTE